MIRKLVLLAVAVAFVAPTAAEAVVLVKPCHGETYRYGALVYDPTTGTYRRMCIEQ